MGHNVTLASDNASGISLSLTHKQHTLNQNTYNSHKNNSYKSASLNWDLGECMLDVTNICFLALTLWEGKNLNIYIYVEFRFIFV